MLGFIHRAINAGKNLIASLHTRENEKDAVKIENLKAVEQVSVAKTVARTWGEYLHDTTGRGMLVATHTTSHRTVAQAKRAAAKRRNRLKNKQ